MNIKAAPVFERRSRLELNAMKWKRVRKFKFEMPGYFG